MQEIVEIGRATQDELRDDLRELFQGAIRLTLEMVLEEELKAMVGARRFERVGSRKDHRNGTYLRRLLTSLGQIEVAMPRSRDNGSPADVIGRYQRRSPELDEMMVEAYVSGVSQRKMGDVTEALMGERVGRSTVSRVAKRLDEAVEGLRRAPIEGPHPYLYLDATFLDARWARKVENVSALVAYAVGPEGHRRLLAVTLGAEESQQSWSELLEQLQDRGLGGVELVIADEHAGLAAAVRRFLPEARRQRCTVHLQRNVGARVPHRLRKRVAREVSVIFQTSGLAEAKKLLGEFGARWKKELPEAVEVLERGFGAATQFYAVPRGALAPAAYHQQPRAAARRDQTQDQGRRRLPGPGQRPQAHHGRRTQDHTRLGRPALPRPLTPPETGGRPSSLAEGEELPPLLHTNRDLTGATLPGVVGGGEVESRSGCCFDRLVAMELGSVVGRDGMSGARGAVDEADRSAVGGLDGASLELTDHHVARLAIDEREHTVLVGDVTDHRICFKVADSASILCTSGSLVDVTFSGQTATGIVATVPFSALLGRTAEMQIQASALLSIAPDVAVDGLVADRELPLTP